MPVTWFQSQQIAEAPVAPLSSQQAAARWEPSIQDFVTELGGYTIPELQQCIDQRWKTKFNIAKVWKAMDAISDRGVQSYLQHHYVIIMLQPADAHDGSSETARQDDQTATEEPHASNASNSVSSGMQIGSGEESRGPQIRAGLPGRAYPADSTLSEDFTFVHRSSSGEANCKRQKASSQDKEGANNAAVDNASTQLQGESMSAAPEESKEADQTQNAELKLSTERQLSLEQTKQLQPQIDDGLDFANRGFLWFLRIDRFNEADKWFACASFENAMQTDQARKMHFRPTCEVIFEGSLGMRLLPLECLVPSMARLAAVRYSVFATGNHCQWHARVLTVLIASLSFFLDPCHRSERNYTKVSRILVDGKEQQKYAAMAGRSGGPDSSYCRAFPEASYLKPAIQDLKNYASRHDNQELQAAARKPFPDLHLIYASMLPQSN